MPGVLPVTECEARAVLGKRARLSNKGDYGYIGLIGGSAEYAGAARLAYTASAAMRSGAGVTRLIVPDVIMQAVIPYMNECTLKFLPSNDFGCLRYEKSLLDEATSNLKAIGAGMGLGQKGDNRELIEYLFSKDVPLVLDADALNTIAKYPELLEKRRSGKVVLTPHPGEFSRLSGLSVSDILSDPARHAAEYASRHALTVLLKGADTFVSDGQRTYVNSRGTPGMATAGSGDVLTGIITALAARNTDLTLVAAVGAFVAGIAGEAAAKEYGVTGMISPDTVKYIAYAIKEITGE